MQIPTPPCLALPPSTVPTNLLLDNSVFYKFCQQVQSRSCNPLIHIIHQLSEAASEAIGEVMETRNVVTVVGLAGKGPSAAQTRKSVLQSSRKPMSQRFRGFGMMQICAVAARRRRRLIGLR